MKVPLMFSQRRNFHRRRIKTSCRFLIKRIKSCVYSNKYELFYHQGAPPGSTDLTVAQQLRGAFSDTEDFPDHGLVSANRCSSRTSSIVSWTENIKPSFTKKLKFQSVLEGQPVELKCKLVACPSPTILWFHNNRSIPKERRRRICTDSTMHMHTTSLLVDSVREKDSGSYKVMAINTEGSAESTASLLVSLREEQSANYLGFVRRSAKAHESVDSMAEQRKERKFRVDLRCVGSPFDKMSKVHQGRSRSKSAMVRTVYFQSGSHSKEKESEKESKRLETASERAPSPPPMFDRSERFNDRFSDIYCDRRTGARFSDKFSDRCSDRYSERFSDTESLHNEVRTKLTSLQKAVKQKKRLSISTMSSSEFESESVASESSYADYVEKLRVKPASLPDAQHRPFDLGETPREFHGKAWSREPSQPRGRHLFEPQSRTRAIQIMRGELVDTLVPETDRKSGEQRSETLGGKTGESFVESHTDVRFKQTVSEHHSVETAKMEVELHPPDVLDTTTYSELREEEISPTRSTRPKMGSSTRKKLLDEAVSPTDTQTAEKDEGAGQSLRAQYERSLDAERMVCEEKLLALRIRKWQQGSRMLEEETVHPETHLAAETHYMEPTGILYTQQQVEETRAGMETEATPPSFHTSPRLKARTVDPEVSISNSPKVTAKGGELETSASIRREETRDEATMKSGVQEVKSSPGATGRSEDRLRESQRPVRSIKDRFLSEAVTPDGAGSAESYEKEESLRAQYEKSLEADRMACEEKLLALRIRKWQHGVRMSEEETFHPETDLPLPAEMHYMESEQHVYTHQVADPPPIPTPTGRAEGGTPAGVKARINTTAEPDAEASATQRSPRVKAREEKMLFEKTREERELQLSRENISELKNESEKLFSEEEALTQRIMKWQQDVLMEQEPVKLEPDWVEGYSPIQADRTTKAPPSLPQLEAVRSRKTPLAQTAKEKFLLSDPVPAGFQDQEGDDLPTEGRETRLQRDSEYFVSEEEALAQRILKWQQDVVEQEEVAELESEWALEKQPAPGAPLEPHGTPREPSNGGLAPHGGSAPHDAPHDGSDRHSGSAPPQSSSMTSRFPADSLSHHVSVKDKMGRGASPVQSTESSIRSPQEHLGGEEERRRSWEEHAVTVDKSSSQRFQSEVREERGASSESIGWRQREGLREGRSAESHERGVIKEERRIQEESQEGKTSARVKEGARSAAGTRPAFTKETSSLTVKTGEMSEFSCYFQGVPPPSVSWLKNGHPLDHNPDYDITTGPNCSKLTVFYPTTDHQGTYDCVIINKHGKSICSGTLEISRKVSEASGGSQEVVVTEEPGGGRELRETMMEEELLTFMDSGKATLQVPQAVIHKRRSSDEPLSSSPVQIRITAATPVPEMPEDSGENRAPPFMEKTSEDEGASQTLKHKFTFSYDVVGEAPRVVAELENISCSEGDTVVLECVITGEPAPETTWYYDDVCLGVTAGQYRAEVEDNVYRLYISSFTHTDAGVYKCVARNKLGEVSSISDVSFQADAVEEEDFTASGDVRKSPVGITEAPSDVKASRSRPGVSRQPPGVSGCGLQASAAVIKVSQIKQAFESNTPVAVIIPPSPEEQRKGAVFPQEFIPAVAISLDRQEPVETLQEEVQESPELVKPQPQKPASEMEVREETVCTFDRTSSFFPFQSEKRPAPKRSVRTSSPAEEAVKPTRVSEALRPERQSSAATSSSVHGEAEVPGVEGPARPVLEVLTEVEKHVKHKVEGLEGCVCAAGVEDLISVPEPSMDSGVFVCLPDSQTDDTEVSETVEGDAIESQTQIQAGNQRVDVDVPEPLIVKPKVDPRTRCAPQNWEGGGPDRASAAISSMEEEEVTFGTVYDYYNPPTDWGRPLSPESEMSIEIGSTVSEEVAEAAERFFTPGSSTEASQPIAESFHTPSSDTAGGFMTPQEYPFSPVEHKRLSTGESSERFFSPLQFLPSPADEGVETCGITAEESRFLAQSKSSLGLATLQEKVQGIPPAFLKPLIKKRVFENDSLMFYAEVFGLPSPEVKWFCNKTQLVADSRVVMERDGDSISLTVHNVSKADQGEYICEAVNYVGEARSVALVVVVSQEVRFMPAPPAVTHQHVMEFDVEEDDSSRSPSPQEILLEVELDENEVKEFEKQVKIITIPEYTADNKSMIISLDVLPSLYEEGAVDFVTQEHDQLKIAFEVTEMPPRFINPICDMETPEGTTVMFECSLMGIPSPIVSWFKGDGKLPHNNKKYLHSSDGDNHFLKICKVTPQDSGVYTCRAINIVGETLCRASLVVVNAKAFSGKTRGRELTAVSLGSAKVQPQKFDLMVGNTSFDGEQVSEIELEFEFEQEADESQRAVRLVANTDHETSEQGEKYVSINFDVFAEPAKDDKIEFKGKSSDMCSFQFQVTETAPKCVIPLTNVTAAVGTPVILQCLVSGKPNATAEWFKDGERIADSRCIIQEKTAGHFNLLITNVTQSDAGEYKCILHNSAGCVETTALLKVF
ncbi:titin-like [Embiotoca jacksoni]